MATRWKRGVGFCNANGYGEHFNEYSKEANKPFIIAMIENKVALENIDDILATKNLDAIIIGPYDLSASLGVTGDFSNKKFLKYKNNIFKSCKKSQNSFWISYNRSRKKLLKITLN